MPTDSSVIVATDELQKKLERGKRKIAMDGAGSYSKKWKISIVKHRKERRAWEIFIIFVALYSVMVIPIRIAINTNLGDSVYDVVDMITWIIYLIDVFVNCRTTYLDNFGIEVIETKKILMHYLFSFRFAMDFLSLLNFPTLIWPDPPLFFNLLGLLKTLRFLRAQDLIRQSRLKKSEKASMSCGYFFILLLIYLHIMACIFFTICLQTYKESTDRLAILEDMELRYKATSEDTNWAVRFERFAEEYSQTEQAVREIFGKDD